MTVEESSKTIRWALIGNPNTGKTTLFNRLCGTRARTANYPGITADARVGRLTAGDTDLEITDLPGIYSLELDNPESNLCRSALDGSFDPQRAPEVVLAIAEAGNIDRSLPLLTGVLGSNLPVVLALTMSDLARRDGVTVDVLALSSDLGIPVVLVDALHGDGVRELIEVLRHPPVGSGCTSTAAASATSSPEERRERLASSVERYVDRDPELSARRDHTDRLDSFLTHPLLGMPVFSVTMAALFAVVFFVADYPISWIESFFGFAAEWVSNVLPAGAFNRLMTDGVIGGIGGTVVFVPQIALLFFVLSLLEDSGYLARAAFVVDRPMRKFGLPGSAFVPLLTSHACAIPAIMSARLIPNRRDRLATILVAPFFSCSARLPVYTLLIGFLFPTNPLLAGAAFVGCYVLGGLAAFGTAAVVRQTILTGPSAPILLELPRYRRPRLFEALRTAALRSGLFLKKAGTVILAMCIGLWLLSEIPVRPVGVDVYSVYAEQIESRLEESGAQIEPQRANELRAEADRFRSISERQGQRERVESSLLGFLGHTVEPIVEPIGADWQLAVGIVASFAAREVFVSTMIVVLGVGSGVEDVDVGLTERVANAERDNGRPLFDAATAAALLVFYVLAMQCLPTLAVTRKEADGTRWALLQFAYMSALAYVAAIGTFQLVRVFTA